MKKLLLVIVLSSIALLGCSKAPITAQSKRTEDESSHLSCTCHRPTSDMEATKKEEKAEGTVSIYYFQVYVDKNRKRINNDIDYCFELSYPYGTNLKTENLPSDICCDFRPKELYTKRDCKQVFFTDLNSMSYKEDKLSSLEQDRVIYFANLAPEASISSNNTAITETAENTANVYYFQIYVDYSNDSFVRIHSNVDYRFSEDYAYGTNLVQKGFPKKCDEYEPIDHFGDGGKDQFFFTSLNPLKYEEAKLTDLKNDTIVYFANLE